jgi:glycosyltransferase involved in cell wall biosynthesis
VKRAAFAVPGSLETPTGGYAYDKRIIDELRALGWQIDVIDLGSSFPNPGRATRDAALTKLLAVAEGCPIVIDGLAFGVMAEEARMLSARNPLVALVHHPLALETGLDDAAAEALRASERLALGSVRSVIVTSAPTASIVVSDYAVPAERVTVVRPAADRVPFRPRPAQQTGDAVKLLAIGSITPRKGYDILLEALAALKVLPWHLTIAGDKTRNAEALARLETDISRLGLQDRVSIVGAVTGNRLNDLYADADVFVLASLFEGYGMVFGEAVVHGLPVIATEVGAAREIVPPDAGVLVAPGDTNALRDALRHVIAHADVRARMAAAARRGAHSVPEWRHSANQFANVLEALS